MRDSNTYRVFRGGPDGNEQLTAQLGVILLVLLAALGVTIPDLRQFIAAHLFIGFLLLGPVVAKIASTGYRFIRYYSHDPEYREKGPPPTILRSIGPIVVLTTVVVFASGIVLMFEGPNHRNPWLALHKLSFIVWLVFMALHVLGHLFELPESLRAARDTRMQLPGLSNGTGGRWMTLTASMAAGVVLAVVLIPNFGPWTANGVFEHHRHEASSQAMRATTGRSHTTTVTAHTRPPATRG